MQYKDEKTLLLAQKVGRVIKSLRMSKNCSINRFAREYDLDIGNTSRVEKGSIDVKFVTLWKISEGLGIKLSDLVKMIEGEMGEFFHFFDD